MDETDPEHQYTDDGERENPEVQEGRISWTTERRKRDTPTFQRRPLRSHPAWS